MKNTKLIYMLALGLILFPAGVVAGIAIDGSTENDAEVTASQQQSNDTDQHDHDHDESSVSHSHEEFEVQASAAPTISNLQVTEDAISGWNVSFETADFAFAPQNASGQHIDGQGHAHLYIDGKKVTRLYSNNYHIDHIDEGEHEIKVTLNTNDHREYAVDGQVVMVTTKITDSHHSEDEDTDHSHDEDDLDHDTDKQDLTRGDHEHTHNGGQY